MRFTQELVSSYEVTKTLANLCSDVVEVLPVRGAGVMLEDDHEVLRFVVASDQMVREIEALQIELDEGPCLRAYRTGEQVIAADLDGDERFPRFGPAAMERGLRAVFSFPMRLRDEHVGALNLYSDTPSEFHTDDVTAGQVLADIATTYIINARQSEQNARLNQQLQHALDSRIVIEQAKGKLSEQRRIEIDAAFELLRRHARSHGTRLHTVAEQVVAGSLRL